MCSCSQRRLSKSKVSKRFTPSRQMKRVHESKCVFIKRRPAGRVGLVDEQFDGRARRRLDGEAGPADHLFGNSKVSAAPRVPSSSHAPLARGSLTAHGCRDGLEGVGDPEIEVVLRRAQPFQPERLGQFGAPAPATPAAAGCCAGAVRMSAGRRPHRACIRSRRWRGRACSGEPVSGIAGSQSGRPAAKSGGSSRADTAGHRTPPAARADTSAWTGPAARRGRQCPPCTVGNDPFDVAVGVLDLQPEQEPRLPDGPGAVAGAVEQHGGADHVAAGPRWLVRSSGSASAQRGSHGAGPH